jgi:alanyl-tRNA synthetase
MNQFKPVFLGQVDPTSELHGMKRAVNSQKCIRAGGKHNDLDDVGKDVYHHTFFEMLGNWSFGDYFKAEAIEWSFECLTEVFGLDPDRLYATYFEGDEALGLPADLEARDLWLKYLPASRILPFGKEDNFWEMGDQGPCGPATEIHYDRVGNRDASALVNMDLPDVLEIWNNVFIQFNRDEKGLTLLPAQHIDTGMGFERLASILQGHTSNYDTDVFTPIFDAIKKETGAPDYTGKIDDEDSDFKDMAYRVVADHVRTLTFAITDGATPSNDGRGYVLRRIVRRGARYGKQFLGAKQGFLSRLVPDVVKLMKNAFPEIAAKEEEVIAMILDEEESFGRTIEKGLAEFEKRADAVQKAGGVVFPGEDAFYLYVIIALPSPRTSYVIPHCYLNHTTIIITATLLPPPLSFLPLMDGWTNGRVDGGWTNGRKEGRKETYASVHLDCFMTVYLICIQVRYHGLPCGSHATDVRRTQDECEPHSSHLPTGGGGGGGEGGWGKG